MPKSELVIQIGKDGQTNLSGVKTSAEQNGEQQSKEKTFKTMTTAEKWQYTREVVTIEPLLACYMFAITLVTPAFNHLSYQKSCLVNLGYNESICETVVSGNNSHIPVIVGEVHKQITDLNSKLVPLSTVLPLILSLFWGSFSDRHQIRKPFLLLPIVGDLVGLVLCILSTVYLYEWSLMTFYLLAYLPSSVMGGTTLIVVALFAYIADVSTVEQRTLRIGICQVVILVSSIVANALSGILFTFIGYYGIFSLCLIINLIAILYGLFYIKDNLKPTSEKRKCLLFDLFDPTLIVESLRVVFVKRIGNNRLYIVLFMVIFFLYNGDFAGQNSVIGYYLNGNNGFNPVTMSYLITFMTLVLLKGNIVGTFLFTKVLKLSDYTIIIIALLAKIISCIVIAVSVSQWMVYVGFYIQVFNGLSVIALRSLATKVVRQEDLGRAQSFFGIFETLGATVFVPIYNSIYEYTLDKFPSTFLYSPILVLGTCILILIFMQIRNRHIEQKIEANGKQGIDNIAMTTTENQTSHM